MFELPFPVELPCTVNFAQVRSVVLVEVSSEVVAVICG
jgi:hypothetical protein